MNYLKVSCSVCRKSFLRRKGQVIEARKFGWKIYCSFNCISCHNLTGKYYPCANCNNKIWRTPKDLRKSSSSRFFCTWSCAAIYNNRIRSESLPKNFCKRPDCNKEIPRNQSYCSRACGAFARKRTLLSLKREVLSSIRVFHDLNKRIPVKKEMNAIYCKARDAFGTWNNAIKTAGFKPNPVLFSYRHDAQDGHICDSLSEKIIDDWLHSKNIKHMRNVSYPQYKRMTCDFLVDKYFIEFFGLEKDLKRYDEIVKLKRKLSKKYNLNLIELKPAHLFPKNNLDEVLGFLM